jgi:hypothetical protein
MTALSARSLGNATSRTKTPQFRATAQMRISGKYGATEGQPDHTGSAG